MLSVGTRINVEDRVQVGSVAKTLDRGRHFATCHRGPADTRRSGHGPCDPALSSTIHGAASDPIRVRHLLDHTAGLDDARIAHIFSKTATADMPLAQAVAAGQPMLRVRSRPGTRHSYSNIGYTLAGMVIESITGSRYETYLDLHLLQPLGMHESTFAFTTQTGAQGDSAHGDGAFRTRRTPPLGADPPAARRSIDDDGRRHGAAGPLPDE